MKFKPNIWQRLQLVLIMSRLSGDIGLMRTASKALDILEFSEAETERLNIRPVADNMLQWDETNERFDIELKDKNAASLVKQVVENNKNWSASNREDVFDLFDQLGIEENLREE